MKTKKEILNEKIQLPFTMPNSELLIYEAMQEYADQFTKDLYTKEQVEELLKKQREICADIACVILPSHPHFHGSKNVNNTSIANAPSPLES